MPKEDLPSIDQFVSNDKLPSIEEFLAEEVEQELPSVEDFVEKEEEEIKELVEEFVPEEKSLELNEVLRLINDVRESIPDIPEIKYYDKELEEQWNKVREQRNRLLKDSDWTQISDYDLGFENKEQWATYRQELRDLPEVQSNPFDIQWPNQFWE